MNESSLIITHILNRGISPDRSGALGQTRPETDKQQQELAVEFERIFARQLVEQMTRSLFENDEEGVMKSGGAIYREHIVDILSSELGKQEALGIAEIVRNQWGLRETGSGMISDGTENDTNSRVLKPETNSKGQTQN